MKFILSILISAFTLSLSAQEAVDGFRDWKWGISLSEVESKLKPSDNKMPSMKSYELKEGEDLTLEGMELRMISYGFKKDKFEMASIGIYLKDVDALVKMYSEKYGEAKKTDVGFMVNYEWHPSGADISLVRISSGENENSVIGIRKSKK